MHPTPPYKKWYNGVAPAAESEPSTAAPGAEAGLRLSLWRRIGVFMALLFMVSCSGGNMSTGELPFSQHAPAPRYSPEEAFSLLRDQYKLDRDRYICIVVDDRYFFPLDQKSFSWRKLGYWVDPFTGTCGKYTDSMKYVEDGLYEGMIFERQKDGCTYKSSPHTLRLGTWLSLRQRFLGF